MIRRREFKNCSKVSFQLMPDVLGRRSILLQLPNSRRKPCPALMSLIVEILAEACQVFAPVPHH